MRWKLGARLQRFVEAVEALFHPTQVRISPTRSEETPEDPDDESAVPTPQ